MNLFIAQGSKSQQCLAKDTKPISEKGITFQAQAKPCDTEHIHWCFQPVWKNNLERATKRKSSHKGAEKIWQTISWHYHDTTILDPI